MQGGYPFSGFRTQGYNYPPPPPPPIIESQMGKRLEHEMATGVYIGVIHLTSWLARNEGMEKKMANTTSLRILQGLL